VLDVITSSSDTYIHTVPVVADSSHSSSAASSHTSVSASSATAPKNPKTEALQKARDRMLGVYYYFVKDAYMKSMRPALQQWPTPCIPPASAAATPPPESSSHPDSPPPPPLQPCGSILKELYAHCHLSWDIYHEPAFFVEQLKRHHPTFQLLFMTDDSEKLHPCYCIIADAAAKEAVVVIRGTKNSKDFATDGKINLVTFPDGNPLPVDVISGKAASAATAPDSSAGSLFPESSSCHGVYDFAWCHEGIFKSSQAILDGGLRGWAQMFAKCGFRLRLCGHSLGAGVAVIISLLLRQLPTFQLQPSKLQVFVVSPPACVSESLARSELCLQVKIFV
jgi:hypothetical protein